MIELPVIEPPFWVLDRVAFVGPMCVGKTYMAKKWKETYGGGIISFAAELKLLATNLFGVTQKTAETRVLYQNLGSALRSLDHNVWIAPILNQVARNPRASWIVDDVRYVNEANALRAAGFFLIKVWVPEWVRVERVNSLYPDTKAEHTDHPSEWEHKYIEPDFYLRSWVEDDFKFLEELMGHDRPYNSGAVSDGSASV